MSVKYTITEKANPQKPQEPKKWYANAKSTGEVTLKALGKEITQRSTVNHADTVAVLEALNQLICEHLAEGEIVRLGELGSFQVNLSSHGSETPEKFNSSLIKSGKIQYRPGADIKAMLKGLKFEKYKS